MPQERVALEKKLKPHWVWAIAFGSAIGWGSFVLPTEWMAAAGPMGVILGFWIGGALLSLVGVSAGYLIKAYPVTGGAFTYAYLAFGRKHAFFCGWFLIIRPLHNWRFPRWHGDVSHDAMHGNNSRRNRQWTASS